MYRNDFLLIPNRVYQCIETTLHRNDRLPHTNFDLAFTSIFLNFKTTFSCSLSGFGAIATATILEPKCLKKKHSLNMMHINVELGNCKGYGILSAIKNKCYFHTNVVNAKICIHSLENQQTGF